MHWRAITKVTNPYPGLGYLFLCVANDNKIDVPAAGELIKKAVDAYVNHWNEMIKIDKREKVKRMEEG